MTDDERHYGHDRRARCDACHGVVSVPSRRRTLTLDEVMRTHVESCPSRGIRR